MNNGNLIATEWVLIESAAQDESEDGFRVLAVGAAGPESRTIQGITALRKALIRLAPRRVILDFEISFRRGLELLRTLKGDFPGLYVLARGRSQSSPQSEPLYFSVELRRSGMSFHRVNGEDEVPLPPFEASIEASDEARRRAV